MNKKELQKKLNQAYSTENWREIVKFVFPNVSLREKPAVLNVEVRFQDIIESFKQIGDVRLHDGKTLALLELKVKENVNIVRNRVRLNEVVSSVIDTENANGVLSIFEKGTDDYRFTFSASASEFDEEEGNFKTTKTDTKRFTYVLGKNESCKTPAQRFFDLSENKNKAEIKDIENAFSVEKLSKAFFKEYKDQYTAFVNYMMQTPGIFKAIYSEDDKAIRDFVKILLGRIIFIKFVQKKGWMGVDASSQKWIDGDYRFMENGFENFKHQDLFYSTFLEPLFDTLNQPNRPNDLFEVTQTRVPYLSGGLFELEDKKTKNINFPANYFAGLFEFLDRYNFTIDENDTNDHEVGIDPEMLGHIFENLLEDNKDKGAFYTPKEIVRYMCQESLKEYLKTSLENNKQWPTDETEAKDFEQALHNFVTKKEAGGIIEFEETIAKALKDVKICDPAIGSGAFPMGLLNEIFQLVHKLHDANKDKVERVWELKGWQPNLVKQNIIQNSIYGVDIEKGAVDVARLRFWLSLIVDEPEPKALPHLDYKIVVGNSLVSKLDDTIIDIDWNLQLDNNLPETDLFGKPKPKQFNAFEVENDEKQKQLLKEISAKQKLVFNPNSDEAKLSLQIRNLKIDLLINQLDAMVKTKGVVTKPTKTSRTIKAQTELWLQTIGWKQQIEKLQKLRKDPNGILHFFDWKLDFPEIMNETLTKELKREVGFDIVIGNPPYVEAKKLKHIAKYLKKYSVYSGTADLSSYFFELGLNLSKLSGVTTLINTNKFFNTGYGKPLRELILQNEIKQLLIFEQVEVFEGILVSSVIISIQRKKTITNNIFPFKKFFKLKNVEFIPKFVYEINNRDKYNQSNLTNTEWSFADDTNLVLKSKIEKNGIILKNIKGISIYRGVTTGYNPAFIINDEKKQELIYADKKNIEVIKSLLQGRNIRKWIYNESDENLIFMKQGIEIEKYLFLKNHLLNFHNELKPRSGNDTGGRKPGNYKWYEIQDNTAYFNEFEKPEKIIWGLTADKWAYAYDDKKHYLPSNGYILTSEITKIKYLLGLFNSNLLRYYFGFIGVMTAGGAYTLKLATIQHLPIKIAKNQKIFIDKVEQIFSFKSRSKDTTDIEQQIDNLVYKLYELTYDEVLVVEPEFAERMSKTEYEDLKVE